MIFNGRAGSAPLWYMAKIVADWNNCSVQEARGLPWREWMQALTARRTEAAAEKELERRQAAQMRTPQAAGRRY